MMPLTSIYFIMYNYKSCSLFVVMFLWGNLLISQKNITLDFSVHFIKNEFLVISKKSQVLGRTSNSLEKIESNPSIGIQVISEIYLSEKIALYSGLYFTQIVANQTIDGLIFPSDIDPTTGVISTSSLVNNMKFTYIGVPIGVRYNYSLNNHHFFGGIGFDLVGQISSREKGVIMYGDGNEELLSQVQSDFSAVNYLGNFHIGYSLDLNEKYKLYFSPFLKYGLASNGETYLNESSSRYFSYGISAGVNFKIN